MPSLGLKLFQIFSRFHEEGDQDYIFSLKLLPPSLFISIMVSCFRQTLTHPFSQLKEKCLINVWCPHYTGEKAEVSSL